jgi:hypothetical protein
MTPHRALFERRHLWFAPRDGSFAVLGFCHPLGPSLGMAVDVRGRTSSGGTRELVGRRSLDDEEKRCFTGRGTLVAELQVAECGKLELHGFLIRDSHRGGWWI